MSLAGDVLAAARARRARIATAESCTGGLIAGALTEVAGSSDVVDRGFVTYSNAAKQQMLGVGADTLQAQGAVSEAVAAQMALGALSRSEATLTIAVTGIAGPGGSEHKPEGRVCYALATASGTLSQTVEHGALGRAAVRAAATLHALTLVQTALDEM